MGAAYHTLLFTFSVQKYIYPSQCCLLLLSHSSAEHSEGHPVFAPTPVHVQVHCISRGLRARPFSMTPPCRQPHSPSSEELILLSLYEWEYGNCESAGEWTFTQEWGRKTGVPGENLRGYMLQFISNSWSFHTEKTPQVPPCWVTWNVNVLYTLLFKKQMTMEGKAGVVQPVLESWDTLFSTGCLLW